ncbi:centromere protein U [Kryptolebias marmoratus]|uniref:Centromere protein U n=1 Tax=Kryptolebias marmoratus TaxID=37003 RepID=A0A3Q3F9S8_KRYMA|nr:centromere protein U [Kryptolebias marmoratus]
MSTKKGKKVVPDPPEKEKEMDSPNLSTIERTTFMEVLQQNFGNPLHSTALEEDLNVPVDGQGDKRTAGCGAVPKRAKAAGRQPRATVKRTKTQEEEKKRRSTRVKDKARGQLKKDKKTETESSEKTSSQPEEDTDSGAVKKRRSRVLSSDEGTDEDTSWIPSPKKAKVLGFGLAGQPRKSLSKPKMSSSGSEDRTSGEAETSSNDRQRRKRPVGWAWSQFEVVLDAFLDFCDQYKESVESTAVKQTVSCFSKNVKEQLLEKISSLKELQTLKRENTKAASLIRAKTQRLLDAKSELMRAERQLWLLQKEEAELRQRLADIKQGQSFLHGIRGLSRRYLGHRMKHRAEKETYGASSLPALLLETKLVQTAASAERR